MKEVIKNYNFTNFDCKFKNLCVEKKDLTIENFYNISVNNGKIQSVSGFENFYKSIFPVDLYELFFANYSQIINDTIYITDYIDISRNNKSYYFILNKELKLYKLVISENDFILTNTKIEFNTEPEIYKDNGNLYFYAEGDKFIYYNSSIFITISDFAEIYTICNFEDKTFFVSKNDKYHIYYDKKCNIEDFGDNLAIYDCISVNSNDGEIIKLIKLKNYLYVVQQYAISRVIIQDDEYYLSSNCYIKSQILDNSIGELNDYFVFLSSAGLFIFDGNEVKEIFSSVTENFVINKKLKTLVFNNNFYVLTEMKINEDLKNVIFEFDINNENFKIYLVENLYNFYILKSSQKYELMIVLKNSDDFEILKLNKNSSIKGNRFLKFNKICFDDNISKSIVGIKTISDGNFCVKISNENGEKIFNVSGQLDISSFGLGGYSFDIEISSDEDFVIYSLLLKIQTVSEQL